MKFLLAAINAKYIHSNPGVYSLRAFARTKIPGADIEIGEYTINHQMDLILQDIYRRKPDFIGFSCYIWNISYIMEIVRDVKKVLPEAEIWLGGPEVSYDAKKVLTREPDVRGIMRGEGELTFTELVRAYLEREKTSVPDGYTGESFRGQAKEETSGCAENTRMPENAEGENAHSDRLDLSQIPGITYRAANGEIEEHGPQRLLSLDEIPFYYDDMAGFENRIVYYESSRGCPFSCSYCLSSIDKKLRFRDTETVKKELQFFIDNKVPQVKFVDRTFNCKHDHAMAIWKYINEHDNGVTNFHFEISADLLREEELQEMSTMRPGLIQLEIGVQSTNPDTIKAIHRTMDFEKLKGIVDRIHSFGNIHQHLDLIAGLPYEDYDSFRHSFNDVYALKPQQLQLGFLKVLKGSHMMEMCREYGIVYKTQEPYEVLSTKWLDYDHVLKLKTVENMVEVYYNSGQFQNTLEYLENFFPDAFSIYERLGSFYMEKGYGDVSHTRMRRYEILLEFLEDVPEISMDQVKDQMVYDLYLRENLKSRPGFARDQKPFERQIWDFRKREKVAKNAHVEVFADGTVLLFNYADRDPLTNNAHVTDVTKDVFENLNRD